MSQTATRTRARQLITPALLERLQMIARRRAPHADAADAVQQVLIDVWQRGSKWHEGRIVLQLKSILRNQARSAAARARREASYVLMMGEP